MSRSIRDLLREAQRAIGSESPWLDAIVLLEWAADISREKLLAEMGTPVQEIVSSHSRARFENAVKRREAGLPVAYITGKKEFFGRLFRVTSDVLIPRADTEILVEYALSFATRTYHATKQMVRVHDCCTGSGCVAVTMAAELEKLRISAEVSMSDISSAALTVADGNAKTLLKRALPFWEADLLSLPKRHERFHLITANPPYLTPAKTDDALLSGWEEPRLALDGGERGLEVIERLVLRASDVLLPAGALFVECSPEQVPVVVRMMYESSFSNVYSRADLSGAERVIVGEGFRGSDNHSRTPAGDL